MLELIVLTLVVSLAGYRLARAVTQDDITEPFRKRLYSWTYEVSDEVTEAEFEESKHDEDNEPPTKPRPARQFVYGLLTCPICIGWWITIALGLFVSAQLTDAPLVQHALLAVAAAGGQCWLHMRESSG